ncbi:MAG: hypothetical protein KAI72_02175, partial [Candidatus Pacebacteria bacterium]|nr:hypothetical protein [Candidatus Paceibacterota bacterium]
PPAIAVAGGGRSLFCWSCFAGAAVFSMNGCGLGKQVCSGEWGVLWECGWFWEVWYVLGSE